MKIALLALLLTLQGCVAAVPVALSTLLGGIGVYQRFEDRQAQLEQTAEIRKLREAIEQRWPVLYPMP